MKNYLRKQDKLADTPGMSYKGEETYGTSLGGCCSFSATIFTSLYFLVIMAGFYSTLDFNADVETLYHMPHNAPKYDLNPNDLIPSFLVYDYNDPKNITYSDENGLVTWYFYAFDAISQKATNVTAIKCDEYIEKYL